MKEKIAEIKLSPGQVGFYDELTNIHLTIASPFGQVYRGMNTSRIKASVASKKLILLSGTLSLDEIIANEMKSAEAVEAPVAVEAKETEESIAVEVIKETVAVEVIKETVAVEVIKETVADEVIEEAKASEETETVKEVKEVPATTKTKSRKK